MAVSRRRSSASKRYGRVPYEARSRSRTGARLAVTPTTGPNAFAGSHSITSFHSTTLQPYVGFIWNFQRWYLHGFTALDIPTDSNDVTLMYNDIGVGYFLYRNRMEGQAVTAIVPTFEVQVEGEDVFLQVP